jgi:hypothetical protein
MSETLPIRLNRKQLVKLLGILYVHRSRYPAEADEITEIIKELRRPVITITPEEKEEWRKYTY